MQGVKIRLVFLVISIYCSSQASFAQNQLNFGVGVGSVRGDLLSDFLEINGVGPHVQADYLFQLNKAHFLIGPMASFTQNVQTRAFRTDSTVSNTIINMQHTFVGAQLKTYLASSYWIYNPYPGRVLPYLNLAAGAVYFSTNSIGDSPINGFKLNTGSAIGIALSAEIGVEINLNRKLSLIATGHFRGGADDFWDGLAGTGDANDLLVAGQVGICYTFRKKEVF